MGMDAGAANAFIFPFYLFLFSSQKLQTAADITILSLPVFTFLLSSCVYI